MEDDISIELRHINKKLDRIIKHQDEITVWQRDVEGRLSAGSVHLDTLAAMVEHNKNDIKTIRRDNRVYSAISAAVGGLVGFLTSIFK